MSDQRKDQYDLDDTRPSGNGNGVADKIRKEIEEMTKKHPTLSQNDIESLYHKYRDSEAVVDEVLRARSKKFNSIRKKAREIAEKIYRRYGKGERPFHEIISKMMKYKSRHKWSDVEFDEFRKELTALLTGNRAKEVDHNQAIGINRSRINRALGRTNVVQDPGLNIKEADWPIVKEILDMLERSSALHKSVFMQSLIYVDCSLVAMTGVYKRDSHVASNYIHPLIAAMFLPKLELFENHMIYSNIGAIVKARKDGRPIVTEPDALLYYDMTSDPNDIVCDINSPMADLRNRYKVQIQLWENVLKLRNGNYYDAISINEFTTALNACRNNLYDNADLAYNQDEGSMLRKLLNVFSLRPTFVSSKPLASVANFAAGPFNMSIGGQKFPPQPTGATFNYESQFSNPALAQGFMNQPQATVTTLPMVVVQIPPNTEGAVPTDLRTATSQTLWINENGNLIPKEHSIIYSKEVLIFYVNRRIQRVQMRTFTNPLSFSQLPMTMSSFERLNSYPINVPTAISLGRGDETFQLRSVVTVTQTQIKQSDRFTNIITGSNALIMRHRDLQQTMFEPTYYLYDPFGASLPVLHPQAETDPENRGWITNKPISSLEPFFSPNPDLTGGVADLSFFERASTTGTIYIYAKPTGYNPRETIVL
ncbi:Major core protein 4b [uncultured virus]|nr:Major core protein 4b [uncultured virus]